MKKTVIKKLLSENREFLEKWLLDYGCTRDKPKISIQNTWEYNNDTPFLKINNWHISIKTKYSMICHMELKELQNEFSYYYIDIIVTNGMIELRIGE